MIQTDLPLPVEPATSKCGVLSISHQTTLPIIFLPSGQSNLLLLLLAGTFSITSLKDTGVVSLLGISIPTVLLPGIGASILISFAASTRAISL